MRYTYIVCMFSVSEEDECYGMGSSLWAGERGSESDGKNMRERESDRSINRCRIVITCNEFTAFSLRIIFVRKLKEKKIQLSLPRSL